MGREINKWIVGVVCLICLILFVCEVSKIEHKEDVDASKIEFHTFNEIGTPITIGFDGDEIVSIRLNVETEPVGNKVSTEETSVHFICIKSVIKGIIVTKNNITHYILVGSTMKKEEISKTLNLDY